METSESRPAAPSFDLIIVDDEEVDRYLARRTIRDWSKDVRIVEYDDPSTALDVLSDNTKLGQALDHPRLPLVVLLDINMPVMTGFDVLAALNERLGIEAASRMIFVVVFTSSANPHDQSQAESFEMVRDYIVKPVEKSHLDRIAELVQRSRDVAQ